MGVEDDVKVVDGEKIENVANYWLHKSYYNFLFVWYHFIRGSTRICISHEGNWCHMGPKS